MTISAQPTRKTYNCVGSTGPYSFPYRFLTDADLIVSRIDADGTATLALGADYTVTGAGDDDGGEILTTVAYADGQVSIWLNVDVTQTTAYTPGDPFPAQGHEDALDKLTLISIQTREDLQDEVDALSNEVAALAEEVAAGGGGGGGGGGTGVGVIRYSYNPATPTLSLSHQSGLTVGDYIPTGWFDSNRQMGARAGWEVLSGTPGTLAGPAYNATDNRIVIEGSAQRFALVDDTTLNLAQIGLLSDDTVNTQGQEAIFTTARDYALGRFASDIQAVINPLITGQGIVWTTVGLIDMKMASWVAGSALKIIAKNGIKDGGGVDLPYPIIRFGVGTSPQNRFSIARDVDVYVEGNQDSNLSNTTTRVVGVEIYDDTGSSSTCRIRANRLYVAARIKGNTEKKRIKIAGVYNTILCDYVQQRVKISNYVSQAAGAAVADLENYLMLEDGGTSGYKGEWNATLNQQGLATGNAVGKKGAYYKIVTGGTIGAIDGRTSWSAGKWIVSDGVKWWQVDDTDDTPDTNHVELSGQNSEMLFRTTYNADCSAIVDLLHESRQYKGGTVQAYRSLTESLTIPTPAILDQGGKWFKYTGHARAGDQLLFGFTGKDKGTDTTVFDISDNHVYGTMWWFDDCAKIEGQQRWEDCANGKDAAHSITSAPLPVVRINKVRDAGDFRLSITKAINLGTGTDGYATAAVIIGDNVRKKFSTDLNLPHVSVVMGNPQTITTTDPAPNTYIAIQVRMVRGLTIRSPELAGQLDYWADAKKVHHVVPASFVRGRYTVNAAAGSSVTIEVQGDLTATEAFGIAWPDNVRVIAMIEGMLMIREAA